MVQKLTLVFLCRQLTHATEARGLARPFWPAVLDARRPAPAPEPDVVPGPEELAMDLGDSGKATAVSEPMSFDMFLCSIPLVK